MKETITTSVPLLRQNRLYTWGLFFGFVVLLGAPTITVGFTLATVVLKLSLTSWMAALIVFLPLIPATMLSRRLVEWYFNALGYRALASWMLVVSALEPEIGSILAEGLDRWDPAYVQRFCTDTDFRTRELQQADDRRSAHAKALYDELCQVAIDQYNEEQTPKDTKDDQ